MKKLSRKAKAKIGRVVGFLMYSIGAGVAIGYAEVIGYQNGYEKGADDMKAAQDLQSDIVKFTTKKEDK
jgi:hypothetical protein